jgi:hypothetical protein
MTARRAIPETSNLVTGQVHALVRYQHRSCESSSSSWSSSTLPLLFLQLQTGGRGPPSKPRHIARPLDESLLPLNDTWHVLRKVGPAREVEMRTRRKSVKSAQAAAFCGATVFAVLPANVLAGPMSAASLSSVTAPVEKVYYRRYYRHRRRILSTGVIDGGGERTDLSLAYQYQMWRRDFVRHCTYTSCGPVVARDHGSPTTSVVTIRRTCSLMTG